MAQQTPLTPYAGSLKPSGDNPSMAPAGQACDNEKGTYDFPFTENGITVDGSGTGSYVNYEPGWPSCDLFCKANCMWIGFGGPGTYTNTFSTPVNDMIYKLTGTDPYEVMTITTNNGTASITYVDGSCPQSWTIAGNVITCISYSGGYGGEGGMFQVHSSSDFTSITFSHNGEANGTVLTMCFDKVLEPVATPISNWALLIGGILIVTFVAFRYRRIA